jgi:hypothetical protein
MPRRHGMDDPGAVAAALGLCSLADAADLVSPKRIPGVAARATIIVGAAEALAGQENADGMVRASNIWINSPAMVPAWSS